MVMNNKLLSIIAVFIGLFLPMKMQAQNNISAPIFTFEGDNLVMTCETPGASIYYVMSEYADEEEAYSLVDNLDISEANSMRTLYTAPFPVTKNVVIKAIAKMPQQQEESEVKTIIYSYTAWSELLEAIDYGTDVLNRAQNNPNVSDDLKENLQWAIEDGQHFYQERGMMPDSYEAVMIREHILEFAHEIEEIIGPAQTDPEPYAVLSNNNTILTFYYDEKKAERNGMDVGTLTYTYDQEQGSILDSGWFEQRENITSVVFDASFANCTTITNTGYWFYGMTNLHTIVDIGNLNTLNVTNMSWMFYRCSSLEKIDLNGFHPNNLTQTTDMFQDCTSLKTIDVSGIDFSHAIAIDGMFEGCSSLTSIDVSNINTSQVRNMSRLFEGCSSVTVLDLSSFNTEKNQVFSTIFKDCTNLKTIFVENDWSTDNIRIDLSDDIFENCTSLVGGAGTHYDANHTDYTYAHIDGGTANPGYFTPSGAEPWAEPTGPEPYAVLSDNNTVLTFYYDDQKAPRNGMGVGPFEDSGKSINSGWYDVNEMITTVVFDDSFANCTTLTSTAYWFEQCENLTTIIGINNLKTDNVTDVNSMFLDCHNIKSIDLSSLNFSNVTNMFQMFEDCRVLENVNFNGVNTENVTNMGDLFLNCHNLKSIDLSSFNTSNVTKMSYMFYRCDSLATVYVGEGWTTRSVTNSERMFERCTKIVGGQGTRFDENHIDAAYAHIDGGTANPGYFTDKNAAPTHLVTMATGENGVIEATIEQPDGTKTEVVIAAGTQSEFNVQEGSTVRLTFLPNEGYEVGDLLLNGISVKDQMPTSTTYVIEKVTDKLAFSVVYAPLQPEPYAVLSGSGDYVLTFRYDKNRSAYRESMSVGPFISSNNQAWYDQRERITTVVFDESFAECTDITSTANWFYECSSLTTIEGIGNLKTDNVTDMSFMFSTCHALKNLDLNTFNTSKAENMAWMFESCTGLTSLDLSNFNTANVTNMNGMFYGCSALETIYVGEGWNASKVGSNPDMFKDCIKLVGGAGTAYSADHTDAAYAHIDGGAANPGYLTSKNAPAPPNAEPYAVLSENNTVLTFYYDDKKAERNGMSVGPFYEETDRRWYDVRGSITKAVFDSSFELCTTLTSTDFWFHECTSLTTIQDITNLNTANVTSMYLMFGSCNNLATLDVSHFNTENVTNMSGMFNVCSSLTTLDVSRFVTSKVRNMSYMFAGSDKLTTLDVSNFNTESVVYMSWMFAGCSELTALDLSNFNTKNVTDMSDMFLQCYNLITLNLSNFNTANVTDMGGMFANCKSLASIQADNANIPAEEYANIGNPNLLVYVNDASLAPEGVQNVVINGHADEIILTNATTGNNNWNCPQAFTAEKITYTREFRQQTEVGISRGWESITLPFNVQSITHESKGQIVPFGAQGTGVKYFWLRGYSPEGLHNATAIEANKPYVISMPNNTVVYPDEYNLNGRITFSAENTTVPATPELEEMVVLRGDIAMMPNYRYIPQNEYIYAINVGQPRERYAEGSVFTRNLRDIRPFEAYTTHADVNGARPNNIRIAPQPKYDITGIKTLESDAAEEGPWYSLDGRQMQTQPTRKGVYIQKGKVIINNLGVIY